VRVARQASGHLGAQGYRGSNVYPFGILSVTLCHEGCILTRQLPSGDTSLRGLAVVVRFRSVPRGDAAHQGSRPRGLLSPRGRMGLASTVGPVLVGVVFAFAWNVAASHGPELAQPAPGIAPTVGTAVDQAADQAWASATPITTPAPAHRARTRCHPASSSRSSHVARIALTVDSAQLVRHTRPSLTCLRRLRLGDGR
jgi:hypothetical protein